MTGDYPGNARKGQVALTVEPSEPETATMALVEANENGGEADPSAIRPALAQLAAVNLDALQRALLDAALSATTTRWATVTCSGCQTRSRVELPMPDVKARLQAIQLLLSESLGKAPIAAELASPQMPTNVAAVKTMGWETMQQVFALFTWTSSPSLRARAGTRSCARSSARSRKASTASCAKRSPRPPHNQAGPTPRTA